MSTTGKKLATDGRRNPRSRHVKRLLALDVGGYFLEDIKYRATIASHAVKWGERVGRRFRLRRLLRPDGEVRQVRIERVA